MTYFLAVDIGASGGRHILGRCRDGRVELQEVYRFDNHLIERGGHLCWDMDALFAHVVKGLRACTELGKIPATIGIDTWGVDFVLLDRDKTPIGDTVAYRDTRTAGADTELEKLVPFPELYRRTGIQKLSFNSVYQLWALRRDHPEKLPRAEHLLMIPDYLNYLLTGQLRQEYTNATTTSLVNAAEKNWDYPLIERLGFPRKLFRPLSAPGEAVGPLRADIAAAAGFDSTVVLPATHDTGSAFLSASAARNNTVTISSGTWSLLGVENEIPITTDRARRANFTNEGGYRFRFRILKNIMGLWMLQSVRRELNKPYGFSELERMARQSAAFHSVIDVLDDRFLAPKSMTNEIRQACAENGQPVPAEPGEIVQCVYRSLAACYADTIRQLERLTKKSYAGISIVGGGCKDGTLNQLTADTAGIPVYAGPVEATALGNLVVQMIAAGVFSTLEEARSAIAKSFDIQQFIPRED